MRMKTRFYLSMAIGVVAILVLGRIGDDWSKAEFYAAGAVVIAVGSTLGLLWAHMAADGDLRRPRR